MQQLPSAGAPCSVPARQSCSAGAGGEEPQGERLRPRAAGRKKRAGTPAGLASSPTARLCLQGGLVTFCISHLSPFLRGKNGFSLFLQVLQELRSAGWAGCRAPCPSPTGHPQQPSPTGHPPPARDK